jgi:hypothetical protein
MVMNAAGLDPRMTALVRASSNCKSSHQRGCYIRIMAARVQLKKSLVVIFKRLGAKTN